jgi:hypothetical protein
MPKSVARIAVAAVAMGAGVAIYAAAQPVAKPVTILAQGADRLPNETASDWVTYADHVVSVTAASETELEPSREEMQRGEGLILRQVLLKVDRVLWSSTHAARPAPRSFAWVAYGWQFRNEDTSERMKMAGEDEPRIEPGHRYVMAIEWEDARCTPGDYIPAQWRGLGKSSTVPFDGAVIGQGEMQGEHQSTEEARASAAAAGPSATLTDHLAGRSTDALVEELVAAKPSAREVFGSSEATKSCG